MNRRKFLKGAGAVAVLVVGGGVWRTYDQGVFSVGEGPAYEPWLNWRDQAEGPLALVSAAILAASPHNTQPWLFKVTDARIDLYADTSRNLGPFDPYLREMHFGLGCAVENMMLAAAANGYSANLSLVSGTLERASANPEPALVASLELEEGTASVTELYNAIPQRHTHRGSYLTERTLSAETIAAMGAIVGSDPDVRLFTYTSASEKDKMAEAIIQATDDIVADHDMLHDSAKWFRHSWSDLHRLRDGVSPDSAGLPPVISAIVKTLPPSSPEANHGHWRDATVNVHVPTAAMFGIIAVRDVYDKQQTLRAGRMWQRLHLWAATQGIAMQPLNQPLEMVDRERELNKEPRTKQVLAELTNDPSWQPTFAYRAGFAQDAGALSARRAVESVLI